MQRLTSTLIDIKRFQTSVVGSRRAVLRLPSLGSFRWAPKVSTSCPLSLSLGQLVATCGQPPSHKGGELHSPFSSCESTLDTTSLKDAPIGLEPERRPGQDGRYWGGRLRTGHLVQIHDDNVQQTRQWMFNRWTKPSR